MPMTELIKAVDNLDFQAVRRLLREGADINAPDDFGQRPLHFAVDSEVEQATRLIEAGKKAIPSADMTLLLLQHGADIRVRDARGETPLDWAMRRRHQAAEKLLREYETR